MANEFSTSSITGLILAGGRAVRMNQSDKGLLPFNGKSLVAHVIERIQPQVGTLLINANRHLDQYGQFGFPVCTDKQPDFKGPLAGLEAGLCHCTTPYLLTVPCDSPFLPLNLAEQLMSALQQQQTECAIACTGDISHPKLHPVFCLLKTHLLEHIQQYLASGGRKMGGWYDGLNVAKVHFDDDSAFCNINTPLELQQHSAPNFRTQS